MTKRKNMTAAQRQQALETRVEQLEMTGRISQMMLQQLGQSSNRMASDLGEMATRQRELQYRLLAFQELSSVSTEDINKRCEELQIKDFTEASDKEDKEKDYVETDVVAEDSAVILTTKTEDSKQDILRSKLIVSDIGFPQLKEDLLGKKVGDVIDADINGTVHSITLLAIRKCPPVVEEVKEEVVVDEQQAQNG